jgi:isopenicillin N synthase-like dioxygenase
MTAAQVDSIKSMTDQGFHVAQLSIISLAKLRMQDASELALLEKAASSTGFFYLDLRGDSNGDLVLAHLPDLYATVAKYFNQPEDAKSKDARFDIKVSQDLGWKRGYGGESFEVRI